MPLHRLFSFLLVLLLCAGAPARAGTTYTFAGSKVDGCTLSGKTYTCPALPLPNWDDKVVIGNNYTVTASGDINFGYNQGLSMSKGATLNISGNLDIGNINPALLQVNGGAFIAGAKFSFGAQSQTIAADITAGSMSLGTGSQAKVTGTIISKGDIAIASNTTIVGPVSGAIISTNSTVAITGDVTATKSFTLCSACTVKGDVKAPQFEMQSSDGVVTGNVDASTSVRLGHGVIINGNVTTSELTMYDTDAVINGNATVDHATLEYHDRVSDTITCAKGNTAGKCDCVTNNSGWPVRTAKSNEQGPYCTGKTQAAALDHFVIGHDASASVCTPSSVTVTACANAACSATYAGGATAYLQPNNQRFDIGASGTATSTVQMKPGSVVLSLTKDVGGAAAASCRLNGSGATSNCTVTVADAALALQVNGGANAFTSSDETGRVALDVTALTYNAATQACVPLFKSVTRKVAFSFAYNNPQTGTLPAFFGATSTAAGATTTLGLDFNATGKATTTLSYADAGQLNINARSAETDSSAAGSVLAVAAPASFKIEFPDLPATTATPRPKAGSTFSIKVTAMNAARTPAATPNFGKETAPVLVQLAATPCLGAVNGVKLPTVAPTVANGVQTFAPKTGDASPAPRMDEAGSFDLKASIAAGYLGTAYRPSGNTTGTGACTGASGNFIPAYFQVEADASWKRKARTAGAAAVNQYYAGEPAIVLKLTAMNTRNAPTVNYEDGGAARDVDLVALDDKAVAIPAATGALQNSPSACQPVSGKFVCAKTFKQGVASWEAGAFKFAAVKRAPLAIVLRATDTDGASSAAAPVDRKEPSVQIRSGRVRIDNGYTVPGQSLTMDVNLEYWNGAYWLANIEDTDTTFPKAAFALSSTTAGTTTVDGELLLVNGVRKLKLTPPAGSDPRTVLVALNLGTAAADASCNQVHPATTGAVRGFLRAEDAACASLAADPRARAVFGLRATDRTRVIHTRESYR